MWGTELLRGEHVRLAAIERADAATIATWTQDGEYLRLYDADTALPQTAEQVMARIEAAQKSEIEVIFGLRRTSDDVLVGLAGLDGISWRNHVAGLHLALGRDYWDQGLGSEAVGLLVRYAFDELNLYRLQLTVFDYNLRALAVYRKHGFLQEGVFREFVERDGRRHDMFLMGLLAPEWRRRSS